MAKTFDHSLDEIARLATHYRTNRTAFHAPGYKEAHVRQKIAAPLPENQDMLYEPQEARL